MYIYIYIYIYLFFSLFCFFRNNGNKRVSPHLVWARCLLSLRAALQLAVPLLLACGLLQRMVACYRLPIRHGTPESHIHTLEDKTRM